MRRFGLSISQAGLLLAAISVAPAIIGSVSIGAIVDRWFAQGRTDAHLRALVVLGLLQIAVIILAMSADSLLLAAVMLALCAMSSAYFGVAAASLQIVTPNEYRGQVSSTFLVCFGLIGLGVGPTAVGWLTTHVFRSDMMVGWAIVTTYVVLLPIAMLLFWSATKPMRQAVQEAKSWSSRLSLEE